MLNRARALLEDAGVHISDAAFQRMQEENATYEAQCQLLESQHPELASNLSRQSAGHLAQSLLISLGCGNFDEENGAWSPLSQDVYAFDAEVFDIDHMYTLCLQGIQAIVPGVVFSDIEEDISGIKEEMQPAASPMMPDTDGTRAVSFTCNGHPYAVTLDSFGDWFNGAFIDFIQDVLHKEGCTGQLHSIGDPYDQCVVLVYGPQEKADKLRALLETA